VNKHFYRSDWVVTRKTVASIRTHGYMHALRKFANRFGVRFGGKQSSEAEQPPALIGRRSAGISGGAKSFGGGTGLAPTGLTSETSGSGQAALMFSQTIWPSIKANAWLGACTTKRFVGSLVVLRQAESHLGSHPAFCEARVVTTRPSPRQQCSLALD
jgi:hypothetical protein